MSKDDKAQYLKYGHGILLKGYKTESDQGFLTAKGFADNRARYQTFDDILYFKNYRNGIFQIIPAGSFEINDELNYYEENNFFSEINKINQQILKMKAKSEEEQFNLIVKGKNEANICFGDEVILKHIDSGSYLSGTIKPSSGTNGAFNIELTKNFSTSLIFKLIPYRSFESFSNMIPLDSPVMIQNISNKGYLTFERVGAEKKEKILNFEKTPIKSDDSYKIAVKTESTSSEIYDCVTHFSDLSAEENKNEEKTIPMPWGFQLHFVNVQNDSLIQHDIVYFKHTENNGVLTASGDEEIVLKELKEETSQLEIYDCLWEIQIYDKKQHLYILRHLISGMTLGVQYLKTADGDRIPQRPKLIDISDGKGDGTMDNLGKVQLRLAKKEGGIINSESYVNICCGKMCLDIEKMKENKTKRDNENKIIQENQPMKLQEEKSDGIIDKNKLNSLMENQCNFEVKKVSFTSQISKNCFVIQEINDDLKGQVLFALSFHSRLIELREDLKWGAEESEKNVSYLKMMQITQKIKEIKDFLKGCQPDTKDKQYIPPKPKRQRICFDLGISELLFELLYFLKKNKQGIVYKDGEEKVGKKIFQGKTNEQEKYNEMYNSIYEVIYQLIKDNYQFKIHVTKWIDFIFDDVMQENEEYQLKTLLELLKENYLFINNFVTDKLVKTLTKDMLTNKDGKGRGGEFYEKKYIEIFRAFCICGKEVNSGNQVIILNNFIDEIIADEGRGKIFLISLEKKNDEKGQGIQCESAVEKNKPKWRMFPDFYKICNEEYPTAWEYFVSYLNLIADMVQGRNKTVEKKIQGLFTKDTLTDLIKLDLFQSEVPILRLIHYLYIESEKFYPIEKIQKISSEVEQEKTIEELVKEKNRMEQKLKLKPIIEKVLQKLSKQYEAINYEEKEKNERLYVTLDFIRETLNLGLWTEKYEMEKILNCVLTILSPIPNTQYEFFQNNSEKPEVVLMVKCKEKCLEILNLIIDYDMNRSVKICNQAFRNYKFPQTRISLEGKVTNLLQVKGEKSNFALDFLMKFKEREREEKPLVGIEVCQYMIEMAKYQHPKLTSFSLQILQRILEADKNKIQYFYSQIFLCDLERHRLSEFVKSQRDKFFTLEYQNTTKISEENQSSLYTMMNSEDETDTGIMQDLYMIGELMKNENSMEAKEKQSIKTLESSNTFKLLARENLMNFTSERTSSNKMKQKVVYALNIHEKVLRYVLNCKEIPTEDLALKLLHLSYKFLVTIIENNQEMKIILMEHIPKIIHHVKKNYGCIDFLKEMYDNNKNMLYNEVELIKLIKVVCDAIENEDKVLNNYKAKLLDFFRYLIYCNERALTFNQIQILKIMQDDSYKTIILELDQAYIAQLIKEYEKGLEKKAKSDSSSDEDKVQIQSQLAYLISYFQIMVSLVDDKCKVNAGKLIKKFPFSTLVEFIRIAHICWPLKRNLRCFLNRLYYFEPEIQTYMSIIIKKQIDNIIEDLDYYIEIKAKNPQKFQKKYFQNPVRFSHPESYLYLNLEENMFTLHKLVTDEKLLEELKSSLLSPKNQFPKSGPYKLIKITERLGHIRNIFREKGSSSTLGFLEFLIGQFHNIIKEFDDDIYKDGMDFSRLSANKVPTKSEKDEERNNVIRKILAGDIKLYYIQGGEEIKQELPLSYLSGNKLVLANQKMEENDDRVENILRKIFKDPKRFFKSEDDEVAFYHDKLVSGLKRNDSVKHQFQKDYDERLRKSANIQDTMAYIFSIIQINSKNPKAFPPNLKIFFLNKITGLIKNACPVKDEREIDSWDSLTQEQNDMIEERQNMLNKNNVSKFIAELLNENILDNIPLANAIFLCGISMLFGGNKITQKNIIEDIDSKGGKIFQNISNLIIKIGKLILKNLDERNYEPSTSSQYKITTIDNYDFYDQQKKFIDRKNVTETDSPDEIIYHKECEDTYRRAFKFLQLLCENNNTENKNYIRDQKKLNSINFINTATNELRNLFSVMEDSILQVPNFLLDFLIEVTQIPVKENQKALMDSSFFEDLCQMQTELLKNDAKSKRRLENGENSLDEIRNLSIKLILSIFEGNDEKIFLGLDAKMDPKFLIHIFEKKLEDIQVHSKKDLIKYLKREEIDEDNNLRTEFPSQIMDIMNILIIFRKLREILGSRSRVYGSGYLKSKMQTPEKEELYNELESYLIHIQINDDYNRKQKVYFPKIPVFNSLSGNLRDFIMGSAKRETHRDKIVSIVGYTTSVQENIGYAYKMEKMYNITEENLKNSYFYATVMSVIICIFMMSFYDVIVEYGSADFTSTRLLRLTRITLSLIQLSMSLAFAYYWYILKIWEKPVFFKEEKESEQVESGSGGKRKLFKHFINCIKASFFNDGEDKDDTLVQVLRVLLFVSTSFFGTFFHPPLFYIHIIDIVCNSKILANIFEAIASTLKSLAYVSLMGVVFVVIFCTVTFSNYMKNVYEDEDPSEMCDSMMTCILALYVSGAIGETMEKFQMVRFVYDMIYIIFFGLLFGNIVGGLILDAFAQLRGETQFLDDDKTNKCYICNISRQKLEKEGKKFQDHISDSHFLWNYVFYMIMLNGINPTDYTGLQYYITDQYIGKEEENVQVRWIPDGEESQFDQVGYLNGILDKVGEKEKKMEEKLAEIEEKSKTFNGLVEKFEE